MRKIYLTVLLWMSIATWASAQVTGTKNIPGDYSDLTAAFADLNTNGVGVGGATLVLGGNQTLTAALELGSATLNASVTETSPLVINGGGFTLTAGYAGTRTGSGTGGTGNVDAVIAIKGTNYVTFRNFVFDELSTNTTPTLAMDGVLCFFNAGTASGSADGCQNINVKACTFNMNKVTGTATNFGVYIASYQYLGTTAAIWGSLGTAPGDMHRTYSIDSNTFNGGNNYICYRGYSSVNGRSLSIRYNTMNNIGGSAASNYGLYAIYLDSTIFSNNTISLNPAHTSTLYGAFLSTNCGGYQEGNNNTITLSTGATTSTVYGLYFTSIGANRQMNGNTIQFGSFPALTSGSVYGLYGTYSGGNNNIVLQMNNNICDNQLFDAPVATTAANYLFYNVGSSGVNRKVEMKNNTITNFTRNGSGSMYTIYPGTADTNIISDNTINGVTWTNNTTSGSASFYGIYGNGSPVFQRIFNNTVSNIAIAGTSTATTSLLQGIRNSTLAAGSAYVNDNVVSGLQYGVGTMTGTVSGIFQSISSSFVFNNRINDLTSNQAAGSVFGIQVSTGATNNVYNNMISNLNAPAATGSNAVIGINVSGGTTANLIHNTVYLGDMMGGLSGGATFGASGLFIGSSVASNIYNNIVNVKGTGGATSGYVMALRRSSGSAGIKPTNVTAGNNIYNVTNNATSYIYGEGLTTYTNMFYISGATVGTADPAFNSSCGLYKTFMLEAGTFNEDQLDSLSPGVYAPSTTTTSFAQNAATVTSPVVTLDFDSVARGTSPDIGALEFSGMGVDATGPSITYTNIPSTTNYCTGPLLAATITDASSVNTTAGTAPRIWYKKSTNTNTLPATNDNTTDGWKWVEATVGSPFNLAVDYTKIFGGVASGDVIEYFVVAQDTIGTPNMGNNLVIYAPGYCASSVALASAAFPVSGYKSFTLLSLASSGVTSSNPSVICVSGPASLNITPSGGSLVGLTFEVQSSPAGMNTWTTENTVSTLPYTTNTLTTATDYRIIVKDCNNGTLFTATPIAIVVTNPAITSTTPAARCGTGTVTLGAQASAGALPVWFAAATGGNKLDTTMSYTTPSLSTTTTYYVEPWVPTATDSGAVPLASGSTTGVYHHMFLVKALSSISVSGMKIKCNLAANTSSTWDVYYRPNNYQLVAGANTNATGWTFLGTVTTPSLGASDYTPIMFGQNILIPANETYSFYVAPASGVTHSYASPAINTLTGSNADLEIRSGNRGSALFNCSTSGGQAVVRMIYSKNCIGTRVPVTATINSGASSAFLTTASSTSMSTNTNSCDDGTGWTYYTDPSDANKFLFGIEWNPTNASTPDDNAVAKAAATVALNVDANAGFAKGGSGATAEGTWTMKRYWNVDIGANTISATNPVNVRFFYDAAEKNAIMDSASVWNTANSGSTLEPATWFKTKTPSGAFVPNASRVTIPGVTNAIPLTDVNTTAATLNGVLYAQFNGIASFSGGTYATGVGPLSPLPLHLINLSAINQGTRNKVTWESANEEGIANYVLQRSDNGRDFVNIATVAAKAAPSVYNYYDEQPLFGINYYRIMIKEENGAADYSSVVSAVNGKGAIAVNAFPNPAKDKITISVIGANVNRAQIRITDLTGRVLKTEIMNSNTLEVSLKGWAPGMYLLQYNDEANNRTLKLEIK